MKEGYKRLLGNSFWGTSSFLFITLVALAVMPYVFVTLGEERFGIYILVTGLIGYYGVLDFGIGSALIKYVADLYERNDNDSLNVYINTAILFHVIMGAASSVLVILFCEDILLLLNVKEGDLEAAKNSLYIASAGFLFTFISGAYKAVLQGLQLYKHTSIIDSLTNFFINIFLVVVLYLGYGLEGGVAANVFISFAALIVYIIFVRIHLPVYRFRFIANLRSFKEIVNFSSYVFLSKVSGIFSTHIVRYVVSFYLGPAYVAYYIVASRILGAIGGLSSNAINAIFPLSAQMKAKEDDREIKRLFIKSSAIFASCFMPMILFVIVFSRTIITLWMGYEIANESWLVLSIITFSSLIGSYSAIPNLVILGLGHSRLIGVFSVMTIILYAVFLPAMTKWFGLIGTSFAMLITSMAVISYVIMKTTKYVKVSISEYLGASVYPHILSLLFSFAIFSLNFIIDFSNSYYLFGIGVLLAGLHYFYLIKRKYIPLETIISSFKK